VVSASSKSFAADVERRRCFIQAIFWVRTQDAAMYQKRLGTKNKAPSTIISYFIIVQLYAKERGYKNSKIPNCASEYLELNHLILLDCCVE
jgi:hypothetical protein